MVWCLCVCVCVFVLCSLCSYCGAAVDDVTDPGGCSDWLAGRQPDPCSETFTLVLYGQLYNNNNNNNKCNL